MLPAVPTICVGQPQRLDPSRCPDGKAILWLQIPDAPRVIKGDAAGEIAATDWDSAREAFADRLEAILARHIKDFDTDQAGAEGLFSGRSGADERQPCGRRPLWRRVQS